MPLIIIEALQEGSEIIHCSDRDGVEWQEERQRFGRFLLSQARIEAHHPHFQALSNDLVLGKWTQSIENLEEDLYKWSLQGMTAKRRESHGISNLSVRFFSV